MRYNKEELKKEENKEFFQEYILDYIERIEKASAGHLHFEAVTVTDELTQSISHHIFEFNVDNRFLMSEELNTILREDDDSQPHNTYIQYFGSLIVYSTRWS